ncbi:MAG TPA: hypothetical protein VL334_16715 [Anaerolineae bacterium]|nr:hypothetical protein [Anaerolineae bacterium]
MKLSTSDPQLVHQILANIATAIERIERRSAGIERAEDFLASDDGIDRLDGITMMLIAIGELRQNSLCATCGSLSFAWPRATSTVLFEAVSPSDGTTTSLILMRHSCYAVM